MCAFYYPDRRAVFVIPDHQRNNNNNNNNTSATMNPQKKNYFASQHFHTPMESDLFCPRYRMADRPDLYMWDSMEGTPGSASSDIPHHMDNNTDRGSETSWETHLKSWPINRPPLAHTGPPGSHGPSLFPSHPAHSQPSTPAPPRTHPDGLSGNPMGAGSGGMPGTPTPTSVSNATSPLVVPQPMKARTIKTYHCRMCDQIFESKSDLLVHSQQIHKQDPKPYKCPTCNKCFANSSYLSQHARIHSGIKPYKCQICERRFTQLCHLQQHIRTHTGEKPYKCQHPGCGKAFSQLSNLQSHSRSHMTDKPYRCNSCYKCFADEQSLREHIPKHSETKHIKTHICRICGKAYTQETYLARHMSKHSGDPYTPQGMMAHRNSTSGTKMNSGLPPSSLGGGGVPHHPGGQDTPDIKPQLDVGNQGALSNSKTGPGGASAFMPLAHQFPSPSLMNSSVPSTSFPFGSPRLPNSTLNSPLSHISPSSTSPGYFPFDSITFPKRDPMEGRMTMSREDMIANSLISLQQIKNFSSRSHPVFPKSEPSSPVHKDF